MKYKRKKASAEWMLQVKEQFSDVDGLTLQAAENALRELNSPPPYFGGEKDLQAREVIVRKLEKHLESKGVEWLVDKYNRLSPSAKRSFMKMIKE